MFQTTTNGKKVDRIIEVARKLFNKYGFNQTTMNMIIKESHISRGTVYNYFTDKQEIYETIHISVVKSQYELIKKIIENPVTEFDEKMHDIIQCRLQRYVYTNNQFYIDRMAYSKETKAIIHSYLSKLKELRIELYKNGKENRFIPDNMDYKMFNTYFTIIQSGIMKNYKEIISLDSANQKKLFELFYAELLTKRTTKNLFQMNEV